MDRIWRFFGGLFYTPSNRRREIDAVRNNEAPPPPDRPPPLDPPKGPKYPSRTGTRPFRRKPRRERRETVRSQQPSLSRHVDEVDGPRITPLPTRPQSSSRIVHSRHGELTLKRRASTSWQDSSLRNGERPFGLPQSNEPSNSYVEQGMYFLDNLQLTRDTSRLSTAYASPVSLSTSLRSAQPPLPNPVKPDFQVALLAIEQLTGHFFYKPNLLRQALYVGARPIEIDGRWIFEANQRLALVGDRALAMVWWDAWYYREETRSIQTISCVDLNTH